MLRFFKLNDPYRLLVVLLLLIGLAIPVFLTRWDVTQIELKSLVLGEALQSGKMMYVHIIDATPWLAAWFDKWISFFFGRSLPARHIITLLTLFFQASFFAIVLIRNRVYAEATYVPALVFALLTFFSFDMLSFSHQLIASTFLLFALNNLFKEIELKTQREETIFNLGLYLGMASLMVLSYAVFLPGTLLLLAVYARLAVRRAMLLLSGFIFPHVALFIYYFFSGGISRLTQYFYFQNFFGAQAGIISLKSTVVLGSIILFFILASLVMVNREARFTRYQSQLLQVMLIWLSIALLEVSLTKNFSPNCLITFIPPSTYLISHYLQLIRRKWIAETMLWVLLFSVVGISRMAQANKIPAVDYSRMYVADSPYNTIQNKKVMMLGNDLGVYKNNQAATYFLDWDLSEEFFEQPDIFQHVVAIYDSFEKEKPAIVIDPQDWMKNVFRFNPLLKNLYQKDGNIYRRTQSEKTN
ncbi:MAG: hypothetical protein JST43_09515 [Bacteroidetes bacterium]|nr:hypothetical protein [Bacteroidota bacterium]MBS1539084.1 hypothetical protein [Bacteroidota bacterium]